MSFLERAKQAAEQARHAAGETAREVAERARAEKQAAARTAETRVTATTPPQISFTISRVGDPGESGATATAIDSATLVEAGALAASPDVVADPDASAPPPDAHQPIAGTAVIPRDDTPEQRLLAYPMASLYGDGRLIRPGPQMAIYPGPAPPNPIATPPDPPR